VSCLFIIDGVTPRQRTILIELLRWARDNKLKFSTYGRLSGSHDEYAALLALVDTGGGHAQGCKNPDCTGCL
jgi:hypothetical protein